MMSLICSQTRKTPSLDSPVSERPLPSLPSNASSTGTTVTTYQAAYCNVCGENHFPSDLCPSKPRYHPEHYYPACDICNGHHPVGHCYWEFLRYNLFTASKCRHCEGLVHTGFCHATLLCGKCKTRHNTKDGCAKRELHDLSNNICPNCRTFHHLHCPRDLAKLCHHQIKTILWCNRCKLLHPFMKCTPFCTKCYRHHREDPSCPLPSDFCNTCHISHFYEECPTQTSLNSPTSIREVRKHRLLLQPRKQPSSRPQSSDQPAPVSIPQLPTPPSEQPSESDQQAQLRPRLQNYYTCPDQCSCDHCAPTRFIISPSNLTPLPSTETLI